MPDHQSHGDVNEDHGQEPYPVSDLNGFAVVLDEPGCCVGDEHQKRPADVFHLGAEVAYPE